MQLSDIENTYRVVTRILDFSIPLARRADKLINRHIKRQKQISFLSDEEFKTIRSINWDADEFAEDNTVRDDLFFHLARIEMGIRNNELDRLSDDDFVWLKTLRHTRKTGRSELFAFKFLVVALAEFYDRECEFDDIPIISFSPVRKKNPKPDETDRVFSEFLEFFKGFNECAELELPFRHLHGTTSEARGIIQKWRKLGGSTATQDVHLQDLQDIVEAISLLKSV